MYSNLSLYTNLFFSGFTYDKYTYFWSAYMFYVHIFLEIIYFSIIYLIRFPLQVNFPFVLFLFVFKPTMKFSLLKYYRINCKSFDVSDISNMWSAKDKWMQFSPFFFTSVYSSFSKQFTTNHIHLPHLFTYVKHIWDRKANQDRVTLKYIFCEWKDVSENR